MGNKWTEQRKQRRLKHLLKQHKEHVVQRLFERYEIVATKCVLREIRRNIQGGFCTVVSYNP